MKIRFLLIIFTFCLFSIISLGQEKNFIIEISKENTRLAIGKDSLVKIKITNKSEQVLNTQDLTSLTYYLSRCSRENSELLICNTRDAVYVAQSDLEIMKLKQNGLMEFQVNMADLYWNSLISSNIDFKYPKNLHIVPSTNIYFRVHIGISNKNVKLKDILDKFPNKKIYESNEIILDFNSKQAR